MDDLTDQKLLKRALHLAQFSKNRGVGGFGWILARDGVVLFEGEGALIEGPGYETCDVEASLLKAARKLYFPEDFAKFSLYCSTEPCPMCAGAIHAYGVGRVVFGQAWVPYCRRMGAGLAIDCRTVLGSSIGREVEVVGPLLDDSDSSEFRRNS